MKGPAYRLSQQRPLAAWCHTLHNTYQSDTGPTDLATLTLLRDPS